jgi:hypothetical protein
VFGALLCGVPARISPLGTINPPKQFHWRDGLYHVVKAVRACGNNGRRSDLSGGCCMDVAALIIEQVEADGFLKRLVMRTGVRRLLTVGFPDECDESESDESPTGPFFFPDEHDKVVFKQGFENCKSLKLSKSSFTTVNGKYHLQLHRSGIFTVEGTQSYYALSLPEFAIPEEIHVLDPRSDMPLRKNVLRDDERKRFVIYIECRPQHGGFDFVLKVKFRIAWVKGQFHSAKGQFDTAEYHDEHVSRYGQVESYETFLSPEQKRHMHRFLASKVDPRESLTSRNPPSTETSGTLFDEPLQGDGLTEKLRNGKRCAKIVEEMKLIKRAHSERGLTITQSREMHKEFEVWAVAANHLNGEDLETFNHPRQWGPPVGYALSLLSKDYGNKSPTTIKDWVKAYRRYQRGIE